MTSRELAQLGYVEVNGRAVRTSTVAPDPAKEKQRAKRFQGRVSRRKTWLREMRQGPGIFLPIYTCTEKNTGGHFRTKAARCNRQKSAVADALAIARLPMPKAIQFTRYGPKPLDEFDNLPSAFGHIVDAICIWYEIDDGPGCPIKFLPPQQIKSEFLGVRIEFGPKDGE